MTLRREISIVAAEATALYLITNPSAPVRAYHWCRRRQADIKLVRHYRRGGSIIVGLTIDGIRTKVPKGEFFLSTSASGKKAMIQCDTPHTHVERLTVINCTFDSDLDVASFTPQWGGAA